MQLKYMLHVSRQYDLYQKYYLQGLLAFTKKNRITTKKYPFYKKVYDAVNKLDCFMPGLSKKLFISKNFISVDKEHVGQYILKTSKNNIKIAIDAHDSKHICSESILQWSDIYFKSNMWPKELYSYPVKVFPIVNGNGKLTLKKIDFLKKIRKQNKTIDFSFISRVWGGREHNIRIFEELAKIPCSKKLLAIFTEEDKNNNDNFRFFKRLEKVGVEYTFKYEALKYEELMYILAQSKLVILRAGKHFCIPWRMLDLLCMGSCIVMDHEPLPQWPFKLIRDQNFFSMDLAREDLEFVAGKRNYGEIPKMIMDFLASEKNNNIRDNNKKYFETYAAPEKIGEYIFSRVNDSL